MLGLSWGFPLLGISAEVQWSHGGAPFSPFGPLTSLLGWCNDSFAHFWVGGGSSEDLRVGTTGFDFLSSFCASGQERNNVQQVLVPHYMFLSLWYKDILLFCLVAKVYSGCLLSIFTIGYYNLGSSCYHSTFHLALYSLIGVFVFVWVF